MIRTIIWFIWFFLSLIISTPFLLRVKYLSKKGRVEESNNLTNKCARIWANSLLKIAGVKVNVHGLENLPKDRTVVYVGNHQGNFDIPIYLTSIPNLIGFISKIEVQKIPLVTGWMNALHCVFMDRSNVRKSGEAIIKGSIIPSFSKCIKMSIAAGVALKILSKLGAVASTGACGV